MDPLFVLSHVAYTGYTVGSVYPFRSLAGAQKAADNWAEDVSGTPTGEFDAWRGWEHIDGDDWDRTMWRRPLFYKGAEVGALEIVQFDEIGD